MRVIFAGTPAFAVPALEALVQAGHEMAFVLSQPDRPAGRGQRLTPSPVSEAAQRLGLGVHKPQSLKSDEAQELIRSAAPDVMVVAAYGLILPQAVLDIPAHGCINIHASLLPRWRGAAPIHRAILAGDAMTGVSIMRMEAALDTGPVLLERRLPLSGSETTGSLTESLAKIGAVAIVEALATLPTLVATPQPSGATYAAKVSKAEARIEWTSSAAHIHRQVRAFNPAPGAEAELRGVAVKVWEAVPVASNGLAPGQVRIEGQKMLVGCGEGALEVVVVQRPGGRKMGVQDFLRGNPWPSEQPNTAKT